MVKIRREDLEPAFSNAIYWLTDNRNATTVSGVMRGFHTEFGGYLLHDECFNWEHVIFPKDEDATMFMLRWA